MSSVITKTSLHVVICLCIVNISCQQPKDTSVAYDESGTVIKQPYVWKTEVPCNSNWVGEVIRTPIIYNQFNVLIGAVINNEAAIFSLSSLDGTINWKWNDALQMISNPQHKDPINLKKRNPYLESSTLFFTYAGSSYSINLSTGQTLWRYKTPNLNRFDINSGLLGEYYTTCFQDAPWDVDKIYTGNIKSSSEEQLLLIPEYTKVNNPPVNAQGHVNSIFCFAENNVDYLVFGIENPYTDFTQSGMGFSELNLYNLTTQAYVYKKVIINPNRETRSFSNFIYNAPNLYFESSNFVHSYSAMDGKENWRTYLGTAPFSSTILLADNKLFTACEDRMLYCLNASSGNVLWRTQNTGTCSEISYLNGVIYYVGGGDGFLHAVDAQTGTHLWKLKSPDLDTLDAAFGDNCIVVPSQDGSKGKVIVSTGYNAYAYEAAR